MEAFEHLLVISRLENWTEGWKKNQCT